jgi:hypothetical protein
MKARGKKHIEQTGLEPETFTGDLIPRSSAPLLQQAMIKNKIISG